MGIMAEIFDKVLRMSAVASIVILTVIIVRFCLRGAPKKFSYILWALVLVRLLCPVSIESPFSTMPRNNGAVELLEDWEDDYVGSYRTFHDIRPEYDAAVDAGIEPIYMPGGGSYVNLAPDGVSPAPTVKTEWLPTLALVWLCGIAAMAAWAVIDWLRLRLRLRTAIREEEGVYTTDAVDSPFVLGLIRPKIYLPAMLGESEREYILLHERCHLRRGDHWIKLLAFAALSLHWFNPLVWLAFVLSSRDMEMSCDEAVIKSLGGEIRADYSASLLALATGRRRVSVTPLAFGEGDTKGRIRNLANWRKPAIWIIIVSVLVCIIAAVCLLTDPVSPKAQINIYGSIYTQSGRERELPSAPGVIYLGELQSVLHESAEPPAEWFQATNLDPKYAGQDMMLPDIRTLYLYDEEGFYLVFELDKDSETPQIPDNPRTMLARGDFDRDGREDRIELSRDYPDRGAYRIRLVDAETETVLWTERASEDEQKSIIHRIGEDGLDYIIIDSYDTEEEKVYSRTIYIVGGREKVVHRSESDLVLPETDSEAEFIEHVSSSLPKNSIVLFSTLGGHVLIGPIESSQGTNFEPVEVFAGDFDHDGEEETAVVEQHPLYSDIWSLKLMNPDGSIAWSEEDFATAHMGWKCILAYEGEDGHDYLVRYAPDMFQGIAHYRCEQFYIDNSNISSYEEVLLQEWSVEFEIPAEMTSEMEDFAAAMESILPQSYLLLSTLGGELHIGPIRGDVAGLLPVDVGVEYETEAWEYFCKGALADMMSAEVSHYTWNIYIDGVHRTDMPQNEGWFLGDDWLRKSKSESEGRSHEQVMLEKDGMQYAWTRIDGTEQLLTSTKGEFDAYGRGNFNAFLDYELSFVSKTEKADTTELVFERETGGDPATALQTYIFNSNMRLTEIRIESSSDLRAADGTVATGVQTTVITFPRISEAMCRGMIEEAYADIVAVQKAAEAADAIIDDGSSYPLAVPYGKTVITDLDGDGVKEKVCQTVNGAGYRIDSFTINGVEYIDTVREISGPFHNPEADYYGHWYLADIVESDGFLEITVYDGGPSGDPVTHFYNYSSAAFTYSGSVPSPAAELEYSGDGYITGPARLAVFQTWFAEHTWSIFGSGNMIQAEPRDFYEVDFRFRDYTVGMDYFPGSDTNPLLQEILAYEAADKASESWTLPKGTQIGLLGTDNREWLLATADGEECWLHFEGTSLDAPGGLKRDAQTVLRGLNYAD